MFELDFNFIEDELDDDSHTTYDDRYYHESRPPKCETVFFRNFTQLIVIQSKCEGYGLCRCKGTGHHVEGDSPLPHARDALSTGRDSLLYALLKTYDIHDFGA